MSGERCVRRNGHGSKAGDRELSKTTKEAVPKQTRVSNNPSPAQRYREPG